MLVTPKHSSIIYYYSTIKSWTRCYWSFGRKIPLSLLLQHSYQCGAFTDFNVVMNTSEALPYRESSEVGEG